MKRIVTIIICFLTVLSTQGQHIVIPQNLKIPLDSAQKVQLSSSLNSFISDGGEQVSTTFMILPGTERETGLLINEMKGMGKNAQLKDDQFYKPYLTNITDLGKNTYGLQISYMGVLNGAPVVHASFKLLTQFKAIGFNFYSPLKENTGGWKTKVLGSITYHYKDTLSMTDAKAYRERIALYDKKLNAPTGPMDVYYCDNFTEAQQIAGIDYKQDYNGIAWNELAKADGGKLLVVNGWNSYKVRFDTHDLFHERLRLVVKASVINRPVDEGCAYLYGGSWGVYKWPDILALFKKYADENLNTDWLSIYLNEKNKNFVGGNTPLKISYAINALIARRYDKAHGVAPMPLLTCGKVEKGDENYFKVLESISGINKANFNTEVWRLIRE
ncbi:MAG TPA: hypothetical protein VIM55_16905 [Mucilaginibacter sp.]